MPRRLPGRALARFLIFVVLLAAGFLTLRLPAVRALLEVEALTAMLERLRVHPAAAPSFVVGAAVLTAVGMPGSVPLIVGGVVFGAFFGGVLAFAGNVGGAALSYFLGHHLARELVVHIFGNRIERLGEALEREGFWTLVRLRFVPVPFAVTNYGACLAGVSFGTYLSSTALALLPITFVYTYFAATLVGVAEADRAGVLRQLGLAVLLLLLLSFVPPRIMAWRRRKAQSRETEPPPPPEDRS
jgi:uncharacterized membrane protein YdjX (TVP38/TMEM64 family)